MNAKQAWQSVLGQLQMEMPRASFDTWVRDTKPVSYQDGTLTVGVRNAYARDWLESQLVSTLNRLLVGILNASASVSFVVSDIEEISSINIFSDAAEDPKGQPHEIYQQIQQADILLRLVIALRNPVPIWKQVDVDLLLWQRKVMGTISWGDE